VFDKVFAREQLKAQQTEDLKNLLKKKDSGEYVPEYFDLVKAELKARGEDPKKVEVKEPEKKIAAVGVQDKLHGLVSKSLKEKLNIEHLELQDLVQLYVWESNTPYFMSLIESELLRRGEDVKKYVKPGPTVEGSSTGGTPAVCDSCGKELTPADNFCSACGNPKQPENI